MFTTSAFSRLISFLMLMLVLLGGCKGSSTLSDADRAGVTKASGEWFAAVQAKRPERLSALYAPDVVLMPMNSPTISGREAVVEYFTKFPPISNLKHTITEIEGRDDLAIARGTFAMDLTIPGLPKPVREQGKYIEVWRRQSGGAWVIWRDIFNSDVPHGGN